MYTFHKSTKYGSKELLTAKARIGIIDYINKGNFMPNGNQPNKLIYSSIETNCTSSDENVITVTFTRRIEKSIFEIAILPNGNNSCEVTIKCDGNIERQLSDGIEDAVVAAFSNSRDDAEELMGEADNMMRALNRRVEKMRALNRRVEKRHAINGIVRLMLIVLLGISIVAFIGVGIWGIFFNSAPSSSSQSREEEIAEDMEFLDNISTPGTSEYDWYHDEYLPDNGYPDD